MNEILWCLVLTELNRKQQKDVCWMSEAKRVRILSKDSAAISHSRSLYGETLLKCLYKQDIEIVNPVYWKV